MRSASVARIERRNRPSCVAWLLMSHRISFSIGRLFRPFPDMSHLRSAVRTLATRVSYELPPIGSSVASSVRITSGWPNRFLKSAHNHDLAGLVAESNHACGVALAIHRRSFNTFNSAQARVHEFGKYDEEPRGGSAGTAWVASIQPAA